MKLRLIPCRHRIPLPDKNVMFEVTARRQKPIYTVIHAYAPAMEKNFTIFLDNETADPMYPLLIESKSIGITISLYSDTASGCRFPPSIPDTLVEPFLSELSQFHKIVDAARELIRKEQKRLKHEKDRIQ